MLVVGWGETIKGTAYAGEFLTVCAAFGFIDPGDATTDWVGYTAGTPIDWTETINAATGNIFTAVNTGDLQTKMDSATAGDVVLIANGNYGSVTVRTNGIIVCPVNPWNGTGTAAVHFTAGSIFRVTASNCTVGGFRLTGSGEPFPGHFVLELGASNNRITDVSISFPNAADRGGITLWKGADYNTVDHCLTTGPGNRHFRVRIQWGSSTSGRGGTYDEYGPDPGNYALATPPYGNVFEYCTSANNGWDGTQRAAFACGSYIEQGPLSTNTTIRYCHIHDSANIGHEWKTSDNSLYNTVFEDFTDHKISLYRSGERNTFRNNYAINFENGLWVMDHSHIIVNNVFINAQTEWSIEMPQGGDRYYYADGTARPNTEHLEIFPVQYNCLIAHNTFVTTAAYHIKIGDDQYSCSSFNNATCGDITAYDNDFINNSFVSATGTALIYISNFDNTGSYNVSNRFDNNHFHASGTCVTGSALGIGWTDSNAVTGDPSYTNTFRPQPASNVVDAGTDIDINGWTNTSSDTDFDGNSRNVSGTADIGAVEEQTNVASSYGTASKANWSVYAVTGEDTGFEASKAIDETTTTYWKYTAALPHTLDIDFGGSHTYDAIIYKAATGDGKINSYEVYSSDNGSSWTLRLSGNFLNDVAEQVQTIGSVITSKYIRLKAISVHSGSFSNCVEFGIKGYRNIAPLAGRRRRA